MCLSGLEVPEWLNTRLDGFELGTMYTNCKINSQNICVQNGETFWFRGANMVKHQARLDSNWDLAKIY